MGVGICAYSDGAVGVVWLKCTMRVSLGFRVSMCARGVSLNFHSGVLKFILFFYNIYPCKK